MIVGNVSKFGCTISWEPPESDGGSPITSYIIELRDRTSVKWSPVQVTKADELTAIVNDVIENKEYIFRVKAENKAGVGKPSAASQPVKIMDPIGELGGDNDWSVRKGVDTIFQFQLNIIVPEGKLSLSQVKHKISYVKIKAEIQQFNSNVVHPDNVS